MYDQLEKEIKDWLSKEFTTNSSGVSLLKTFNMTQEKNKPVVTYYDKLQDIIAAVCENTLNLATITEDQIKTLHDTKMNAFNQAVDAWFADWESNLQISRSDMTMALSEKSDLGDVVASVNRITAAAIATQQEQNKNDYAATIDEQYSGSEYLN